MKKATEKQTEIESEIVDSEILIETEPQPEQPEQTAQETEQPTEQEPEQPTSETQKKKRGRPKKKPTDSQTSEKTISENVENDIFANEQEFENHKKQEQEQQQQQQQEQEQKNKTIFNISGEMLLGAIDFTSPLLITYVGGFIEPELKKVSPEKFMLLEEEKKVLLPAAEAVARENVRLSPMEMLIGGLLIVYTGKIYAAIKEIRRDK